MSEDWITLTAAVERVAARLTLPIGLARMSLWRDALADGVRIGGCEISITEVTSTLYEGHSSGNEVEWVTHPERLEDMYEHEYPFELLPGAHNIDPSCVDWDRERAHTETLTIKLQVNAKDLEGWLEKRKALAPQAEEPRLPPGPKANAVRDAEIRRRLKAGQRPGIRKQWCDEIRGGCGATALTPGYSDERIARVTNKMLKTLEQSS